MHRIKKSLLASAGLAALGFLGACKTIPSISTSVKLMEESYSEIIPFQNAVNDYNPIMLEGMVQQNGLEFWEIYTIVLRQKGEKRALEELDRIVRSHGINTTLTRWPGSPFLSDQKLREYILDGNIPRTDLFRETYGDPTDWNLVSRKRNIVNISPLRWPPESGSDYYSKRARMLLGLEYPRPARL